MELRGILTKDSIFLHLKSTTKEGIIDELLSRADGLGGIDDVAEARESILERERRMSTGMKDGIAIPHGKTDAVKGLVACLGVSDSPVDFDSMDGLPSRIFIMTLSPKDQHGPHLQFLAEVSALLKDAGRREALAAAATTDDACRIFFG